MSSKRSTRELLLVTLLSFSLLLPVVSAQAQTAPEFAHVWTPETGHTDGFFFDPVTTPNVLNLKVDVDAVGQQWKPSETLFVANNTQFSTIDPPYRTMYTLTAPHPILGGQAGDTVWVLPADFTEFGPGIDRVESVTAANGWSNMTLILDALEVPAGARFAIWSGSGIVRFTSTAPTRQTWNTGNPAHSHMNWGFTQTGKYVLTVRGQITHTVNGTPTVLTSVANQYTFCVIDQSGSLTTTMLRECGINAAPFAAGGSFVVGDRSAAVVGNQVTFWGAQWAKSNSLSGGPTPDSFEGFENGLASPSCGARWSSSPANSPHPPDSVPQLMSVVVASDVSQSGSTESGNVRAIAIVQVDPGYGPNPGHAGTGKVLAVTRCS
jgi:surface-anchored protein